MLTPRSSDPLEILIAHHHWGTRCVLDACADLSHEEFHRTFDIGLGSLHDTLRHIIGSTRAWTDVLAHREFRPRLEQEGEKSPQELIALLDEAHDDLVAHARTHPLDEKITRERGGKEYTFTRGGILTHVTTHGVHHRAQCVNMLRQLGASKLPDPSVMVWTFTIDSV